MNHLDRIQLIVKELKGGNCIVCKRFTHYKAGVKYMSYLGTNIVEKDLLIICKECETDIKYDIKYRKNDFPLYFNKDGYPVAFYHMTLKKRRSR